MGAASAVPQNGQNFIPALISLPQPTQRLVPGWEAGAGADGACGGTWTIGVGVGTGSGDGAGWGIGTGSGAGAAVIGAGCSAGCSTDASLPQYGQYFRPEGISLPQALHLSMPEEIGATDCCTGARGAGAGAGTLVGAGWGIGSGAANG
jgi:hypothetical protein